MNDSRKWNILVGCVMASFLTNEEKQELIDFIRMWEERSTLYDD